MSPDKHEETLSPLLDECFKVLDPWLREKLAKHLVQAADQFLSEKCSPPDPSIKRALAALAISSQDNRLHGFHLEPGLYYIRPAAEVGYLPAVEELVNWARHRSSALLETIYGPDDRDWPEDIDERNAICRSEYNFWVREAAASGSSYAQRCLGDDILKGVLEGTVEEGIEWLRQAAYNKAPDPDAQYLYAKLSEQGKAERLPNEELARLYLEAAQNDVDKAKFSVGEIYEHGIGADINPAEAIKWYRDSGCSMEADGCDGYFHAGRLGLEINKKEEGKSCSRALDDLRESAKGGNVDAMMLLAETLQESGFSPDYCEAINWLAEAASHDCLKACIELGYLYKVDSYEWIRAREHFENANSVRYHASEYEQLESALLYFEEAKRLGWELAQEEIEAIKQKMESD